jgi:DNA-binding NtrC family response regulator
LKVIAMSGYGAGDYLKLARALGANETLAKPLDLDQLRQTVKNMIG